MEKLCMGLLPVFLHNLADLESILNLRRTEQSQLSGYVELPRRVPQ